MGTSDPEEISSSDASDEVPTSEAHNPDNVDAKTTWSYWCISSDDNETDSYGIIEGELSYTSDLWLTIKDYGASAIPVSEVTHDSDDGGLLSSTTMDEVATNEIYGITPGYSNSATYYEIGEGSGFWYTGYNTMEWETLPPDSDSRDAPNLQLSDSGLGASVQLTTEEKSLLETKFVFESEGLDLEDATFEDAFKGWIESEYEDLKALTVAKIGNLAKPVFNFQKTKSRPLRSNQLSLFTSADVTETSVSVATSATSATSYTIEED